MHSIVLIIKSPSVHDSTFRIQLVLGLPLLHGPGMSDSTTNRGKFSGLRMAWYVFHIEGMIQWAEQKGILTPNIPSGPPHTVKGATTACELLSGSKLYCANQRIEFFSQQSFLKLYTRSSVHVVVRPVLLYYAKVKLFDNEASITVPLPRLNCWTTLAFSQFDMGNVECKETGNELWPC